MSKLMIIATIVVKESALELIKPIFKDVVDATRREEGNISYELNQDINQPNKFVMVEVWSSQNAIDAHNASDHFQKFAADAKDLLESLDVAVIKKVL